MTEGFLISELDGRRLLIDQAVVLGRNADCDLVLNDPSVSRRHAEVAPSGDGYQWRDLGSSNGTQINGQDAVAGELNHGDKLQLGDVVVRFELVKKMLPPKPKPALKEDSRFFQKTMLDQGGKAEVILEPAPAAERSTELLEAVYSVVHEIATNYDTCNLMDQILQKTLTAIDAQRGALFLAGSNSDLLPCPQCGKMHRIIEGKLEPAELWEIPISQTVVTRVLQQGQSVLYKDAVADSELDVAESIMALDLRSIICAPLRAKNGVLGLLYVDSNRPDKIYSQEDLLLLAAVGNSAGIAIENARMHQEMLEKQRIEQEIATAWTIQEGFLVKNWPEKDPRFQVYGETRPAKTVGGDFYDLVQPAEDIVGILIGDVSGKGVPAALTMAQLIAQFRLYARECSSPTEVIRRLNTDLGSQAQRGMFCSVCYLMLDLQTGELAAANAGHPAALRINAVESAYFAAATGPPLGIMPSGPWQDEITTLSKDETVLLYTDGIVEARSMVTVPTHGAQPPEYGEEGLYWICSGMVGQPPRALIDAVNENVRAFSAPMAPHDDCTMIALRYLGHAG